MLLFRSEEHLEHWLAGRNVDRGAVLTLNETWHLAKAWYVDRRAPEWEPRTVAESQAVLASVGKTGEFWEISA